MKIMIACRVQVDPQIRKSKIHNTGQKGERCKKKIPEDVYNMIQHKAAIPKGPGLLLEVNHH